MSSAVAQAASRAIISRQSACLVLLIAACRSASRSACLPYFTIETLIFMTSLCRGPGGRLPGPAHQAWANGGIGWLTNRLRIAQKMSCRAQAGICEPGYDAKGLECEGYTRVDRE